jgi:hypothetical protein
MRDDPAEYPTRPREYFPLSATLVAFRERRPDLEDHDDLRPATLYGLDETDERLPWTVTFSSAHLDSLAAWIVDAAAASRAGCTIASLDLSDDDTWRPITAPIYETNFTLGLDGRVLVRTIEHQDRACVLGDLRFDCDHLFALLVVIDRWRAEAAEEPPLRSV